MDSRKLLWNSALFLRATLQQLGISMGAESGKAGFLTATYILMVPILGIFLKRKCGAKIWIGVFIALIGMYFLCMNGAFSLSSSDLLPVGRGIVLLRYRYLL